MNIEYDVEKGSYLSRRSVSEMYFFDYATKYPHNPDKCRWCPHMEFKQITVSFRDEWAVKGTWYSSSLTAEIVDTGGLLNMENVHKILVENGVNAYWLGTRKYSRIKKSNDKHVIVCHFEKDSRMVDREYAPSIDRETRENLLGKLKSAIIEETKEKL